MIRLLLTVRAGWGAAMLTTPRLVSKALLGRRLGRGAERVQRVLGARHLAQAAVTAAAPDRRVMAAGVGVDGLHALSMAALAVADRRLRRAALTSCAVASGFAVAGALAAREARET